MLMVLEKNSSRIRHLSHSLIPNFRFGAADIDIDEECPYCGSAGSTAKHAGRVVIHKVFGGKTNPYDIYNRLTTQRAIQPSYTIKTTQVGGKLMIYFLDSKTNPGKIPGILMRGTKGK